jgi:hypothetical protein
MFSAFSQSHQYVGVKATTRSQCAKLIMLQHLAVALDWTQSQLRKAVFAKHLLMRETDNNTQDGYNARTHLNKPVYEWHKEAISHIINVSEISQDLSDSISYLLQIIRTEIDVGSPTDAEPWDTTAVSKFRLLFVDTYAGCDEIKKQATRLLTHEEQQYTTYTTTLGIQESESVKRLTILAAMFLPPSLAIGMLSMQSRFNSLGYLLYDMVGVTILIGYLALLLYFLLKLGRYIQARNRWKRMDETSSMLKILLRNNGLNTIGLLYWTFTLSAFLFGMFKDPALGLRILGYGSATFAGLFPVAGVGYVLFTCFACCACFYLWSRGDLDPFDIGDEMSDTDG